MLKVEPKKFEALPDERLEREIQWRSWFPSDVVLKPKNMDDAEVERALQAFTRFVEDNFKIKVPGKSVPLILRPAQVDTIRRVIGNRNVVILKARQVGFSTVLSAFVLWCALGGHNRNIYILSQGQREARSFLSKCRYAYRKFDGWVQERGPKLLDKTVERMTFDNDSFIVSSPSGNDPIRGETAWLAIVDEWASIPDQEGAWASVEPTTDLGGRLVGLSTAKGEGNFFHWLWVAATGGQSSFHPIFHSWRAVPERDDEWYHQKLADNPYWFMCQEYPNDPEEAFIGSGNPFFDLDIVRNMELVEPSRVCRVEMVDKKPVISDDKFGSLQVWEEPSSKKAYAIGADVAQGLDHGDYSVAYVMEATTQEVVAMWRGHINPNDFGEQVLRPLGHWYNDALLCVESNNHGGTTIQALSRHDYPNLYRRRTKLTRQKKVLDTYGWLTTKSSKIELVDGVDTWMRAGRTVKDRTTVAELKTFVREQSGNSVFLHGSPHDDCVMALGLTVQAVQYAVNNNLDKPKVDKRGSIDWWVEQLDKKTGGRKLVGR